MKLTMPIHTWGVYKQQFTPTFGKIREAHVQVSPYLIIILKKKTDKGLTRMTQKRGIRKIYIHILITPD